MKTVLFLRIASVLTLIHAALHTIGGVFGAPAPGVQQAAVAVMKANEFQVMGVMRSYWDFYRGFGLVVSVFLTLEAIVFWQLGSLSLAPVIRDAAEYIIGNLNEDGYLTSSDEELLESGLRPEEHRSEVYYLSVGCDTCNHTGYRGRSAIHELLDLSDNIREMIVERRPGSEVRRAAEAEGLRGLRASALKKVFTGVSTLHEINRVTFVEELNVGR